MDSTDLWDLTWIKAMDDSPVAMPAPSPPWAALPCACDHAGPPSARSTPAEDSTNIPTATFDVHGFRFEPSGALGFVNEYSGYAVLPAFYIAFAELKHRGSPTINLTLREVRHEASFLRRVHRLHRHRLGRQEARYLFAGRTPRATRVRAYQTQGRCHRPMGDLDPTTAGAGGRARRRARRSFRA